MKKIYLAIILPILLASCLGYKELPVEYDYSYKGNFKKIPNVRYYEACRTCGFNNDQ